MKGVYDNMDSYWNENVLHLSIKNFEKFNVLIESAENAKENFRKKLYDLNCFDLEVVFDDSASDSDGNMLRLSVNNLEDFNQLLKDTEKAEQALNKAMHDLSCFNLKIALDDAKSSE